MTTVGELMTREVETLTAEEDLILADHVMRLCRIRHLPVIRGRRLVGLVTHRDILRAQARLLTSLPRDSGDHIATVDIETIMTRNVSTVTPDEDAAAAAERMLQTKVGCLPVVDAEGALVGIVTESDFLRWAVERMRQAG